MAIPKSMYSSAVKTYAGKNGQGELVIQSMISLEQLSFAAFLNGFTQSFKSNWNQENVYGRNDPIATFQGTVRSFSLSFDIPSGNIDQARKALQQCDMLMKFLYPAYNDIQLNPFHQALKSAKAASKPLPIAISTGKVISHAPLVKVRFANLLKSSKPTKGSNDCQGLLGYLDGVEWSPDLEMGMFLDGSGNIFPKVINLSFGFNVLHQTDVGWDRDNPQKTLYKDQSFFDGLQVPPTPPPTSGAKKPAAAGKTPNPNPPKGAKPTT